MSNLVLAVRPIRYELEPRPAALGGGWRLHLIGEDCETGAEVEVAGGVFPMPAEFEDGDPQSEARATGEAWLSLDSGYELEVQND